MCYVKSVSRGTFNNASQQQQQEPEPEAQPPQQATPTIKTPFFDPALLENSSWLAPSEAFSIQNSNTNGVMELSTVDFLSDSSFDSWLDMLKPSTLNQPQQQEKDLSCLLPTTANQMTIENMMPSPPHTSPSLSATSLKALDSMASPFVMKDSKVVTQKNTKKATKKRKEVEENVDDALYVKRQRNNEAARRSRERKVRRLEELEAQVHSLETEKSDLMIRLAVLDNERSSWMSRERELAHRVLALESQLGESHRALMNVGLKPKSDSIAA